MRWLLGKFKDFSDLSNGEELINLGKAAIEEFSRAIEIDNTLAYAYLSRGEIYYYLNDGENALENIDLAIKNDPNLSRPYFLKVMAVFDIKIMKNLVFRVNADMSSDEESNSVLRSLLNEAQGSLDALVKLNAMDPLIKYSQVIVSLVENMVDGRSKWSEGTLHLINEVIRCDPDLAPAYRLRALIYKEMAVLQGNIRLSPAYLKKAIEDYNRSIELEPFSHYPYIGLIGLYEMTGQYEKAAGYIDKLRFIELINNPFAPFCDLVEVRLRIREGKLKRAKNVLHDSYKKNSHVVSLEEKQAMFFYMTRSDLAMTLREYQEAMKDLDKADEVAPGEFKQYVKARKKALTLLMRGQLQNPNKGR